jgi:hypothetical protein
MGNVMKLMEFYLLSLAFGVSLFTFLAETKKTGSGFIKIISSVCGASSLICLGLSLTYREVMTAQTLFLSLATLSYLFTYLFHKDEKSYFMRMLYRIHTLTLALAMFNFFSGNWQDFLFALSSSLLLGIITYAMLLGHWYLVTPKLSEKPLQYATYIMWVVLAVKIVWTGISYYNINEYFTSGTNLGAGYVFNWLMLTMRVGWGYFVIAVMSYFGYRLISMRSMQSATGMLYAMTFSIFISELISMYMFLEYGIKV